MPLFEQWCHEHRTFLPPVVAQAVIGRDQLRFELEVDAMAATAHQGQAPAIPEASPQAA